MILATWGDTTTHSSAAARRCPTHYAVEQTARANIGLAQLMADVIRSCLLLFLSVRHHVAAAAVLSEQVIALESGTPGAVLKATLASALCQVWPEDGMCANVHMQALVHALCRAWAVCVFCLNGIV